MAAGAGRTVRSIASSSRRSCWSAAGSLVRVPLENPAEPPGAREVVGMDLHARAAADPSDAHRSCLDVPRHTQGGQVAVEIVPADGSLVRLVPREDEGRCSDRSDRFVHGGVGIAVSHAIDPRQTGERQRHGSTHLQERNREQVTLLAHGKTVDRTENVRLQAQAFRLGAGSGGRVAAAPPALAPRSPGSVPPPVPTRSRNGGRRAPPPAGPTPPIRTVDRRAAGTGRDRRGATSASCRTSSRGTSGDDAPPSTPPRREPAPRRRRAGHRWPLGRAA